MELNLFHFCFLLLSLAIVPYKCNFKARKKNMLFIIVDDLRYLTEKEIKLRNIRHLAAKSINFKNAYAQQALCGPSRNSILTGRRPDSLQLYDFSSYWRDAVGNFTTLPQYFKENGYDTYSIGKIFHPGKCSNFSDDYPYSWSAEPYHPPTEKFKDAAVCFNTQTNESEKDLICPVKVWEQPGGSLPDLQSLDYAINFLERRNYSDKPFLLAVGFHKPHIPLKYPRHYLHQVPIRKVRQPHFPYKPKDLPLVAWHPWTDLRRRQDIQRLNISFPFGIMPSKWTFKIKQSYYAAAKYIDDLVGELLRHVDMKNTIVVLTSDHGWSLGENGLWAKYSNFNVAVKVPLIFSIPGFEPKSVSTPVELVDIFPTLGDLAGIPNNIPKCLKNDKSKLCFEGKSLVPLMQPSNKDIDGFAISQYPRPSEYPKKNSDKPKLKDIKIMGYSVKTQRYRYTEWISFNNTIFTKDWFRKYGIELYDHDFDPFEAHNLYMSPKYKKIMSELSELLRSKVDGTEMVQLKTQGF